MPGLCIGEIDASTWGRPPPPPPPLDQLLDLRVHHSVEGVRKSGGRFSSPI